jgi:very-short-patch-repair endonuclease
MSTAEDLFVFQCKALKLPAPALEHKFHDTRLWRFDAAWPDMQIAVEIEGAIFARGRHSRGAGMLEDMAKYNEAARLGWRVFRFSTDQVKAGDAVAYIEKVLLGEVP